VNIPRRYLATGAIVLIAVLVVLLKYWDYVANPWTRDGQVRAEVIQITPRISGPIVQLPIRDNQFVKAGDLLFEIDPRTFQAAVDQARAQLDETGDSVQALEKQVESSRAAVEVSRANIAQAQSSIAQMEATIEKNDAEYQRQQELLPKKATSQKSLERAKANYEVAIQEKRRAEAQLLQARANLAEAEAQLGAIGEANSQVRAALAALEQAELNLEFTQVRAPADGYVTNLNLRLGSQAVANQPVLALVDTSSYWVHGYFRENRIGNIRPGDRAVVTLMTYNDTPLEGRVDSIGWGIAQQDGSTGFELLPTISPTFEWIRLAQRVPVRIHLTDVPEGIDLRVGTTASVLVLTGTADEDSDKTVAAAPALLQ